MGFDLDVNWGSSNQATAYRSALQQMLKLQSVPEHVKTYRPQILLLAGNPAERPALVDFASNITKDIALLLCGHIFVVSTFISLFLEKFKVISLARVRRRRATFFSNIGTNASLVEKTQS